MNKLNELKKQYALLGEEIKKLESEPDGFLGMVVGDECYLLSDLNYVKGQFLKPCKGKIQEMFEVDRGYLNCFKTKEQAEAARYVLIKTLYYIKTSLEGSGDLYEVYNYSVPEGKRIAKELGLE